MSPTSIPALPFCPSLISPVVPKRPIKKLNTIACGKIIKKDETTQMRELNKIKKGCSNQASKLLKPNGQMERVVKMTKKDQGERGLGGKIHYSHPIENRTR